MAQERPSFRQRLIEILDPVLSEEGRKIREATQSIAYHARRAERQKEQINKFEAMGSRLADKERTRLAKLRQAHQKETRYIQFLLGHRQKAQQQYDKRKQTLFRTNNEDPYAYLNGQPDVIKNFMKEFTPTTENEKLFYRYMMEEGVNKGVSLDNLHYYLARIGDEQVLRHLWDQAPAQEDPLIRKSILANPKCPDDLIDKALSDPAATVRQAAIQRAEPAPKEPIRKPSLSEQLQAAESRASKASVETPAPAKDNAYAR